MRYGRLSPSHREYIVERPDTPTPWMNYISNMEGYCGIVSRRAADSPSIRIPGTEESPNTVTTMCRWTGPEDIST
jgi:hypothetical protein